MVSSSSAGPCAGADPPSAPRQQNHASALMHRPWQDCDDVPPRQTPFSQVDHQAGGRQRSKNRLESLAKSPPPPRGAHCAAPSLCAGYSLKNFPTAPVFRRNRPRCRLCAGKIGLSLCSVVSPLRLPVLCVPRPDADDSPTVRSVGQARRRLPGYCSMAWCVHLRSQRL
jgi:hypothetical protein